MKHKNIDQIKSLESPPKLVNIFLDRCVNAISLPSSGGLASDVLVWRSMIAMLREISVKALAKLKPTGPAPTITTSKFIHDYFLKLMS